MRIKLLLITFFCTSLFSCRMYDGVEGIKANGSVEGGSPSKSIRKDIQRTEKRQKRQYDREMKKRAKRLGTTKKR